MLFALCKLQHNPQTKLLPCGCSGGFEIYCASRLLCYFYSNYSSLWRLDSFIHCLHSPSKRCSKISLLISIQVCNDMRVSKWWQFFFYYYFWVNCPFKIYFQCSSSGPFKIKDLNFCVLKHMTHVHVLHPPTTSPYFVAVGFINSPDK